ncbi:MAG: 50S ribosomal protein L15 [Phycisphaerales bacterium]|nr:50S ribosomal protein L15 [Phycisphaerales bacterium]
MQINNITSAVGANRRRKRVGRGIGSGHGKTCGRGSKGHASRSGGGARRMTEGGQMPIFRRIAKRGFSNANFRTEYELVNLGTLDKRFDDGEVVDFANLRRNRLVHKADALVKVLGKGELTKKLTVEAHAFSEAAKQAIEKAGGSVKLIERADPAEQWRAKRRTKSKTASTAKAKPAPRPKAEPANESE